MDSEIIEVVKALTEKDWKALRKSEESYGDSWRKRGGVGAFMMLARKWDRINVQVEKSSYDVFHAVEEDGREEGILDDIKDLRRYLLLVEAWCWMQTEEYAIDQEPIDPEEDT
jgi:hypothetical protein|tara:strand:- start:202 stop:540 length:339 start_codon:yes stop_codon:yes gene_type:complete